MYHTTLQWRTSPRSISVLVERLQSFYQEIYGKAQSPQKLYSYKELNTYYPELSKPKYIHPYRRKIIYDMIKRGLNDGTLGWNISNRFIAKITKDDFARGIQPQGDQADKESVIRQVTTTAQQFGLMDSRTARLTPMGKKICHDGLLSDDLISQLLKMYIVVNPNEEGVFPFETFLQLIQEFSTLSIQEMMFLFGVIHRSDIPLAHDAIQDFRNAYQDRNCIPNRKDVKQVNQLLIQVWNRYFPNIVNFYTVTEPNARRKAKGTFHSLARDYPDAFKNTLLGTGLFTTTGYGQYKKIRVREWNQYKFHELMTKYDFAQAFHSLPEKTSSRDYLQWYGDDNIHLPWVNSQAISERIQYRLKYLIQHQLIKATMGNEYHKQYQKAYTTQKLQALNRRLDQVAQDSNWFRFARQAPINSNIQQDILNIYQQISDKKLNEGNPALWLENITWKAIFSIGSKKDDLIVHYNGKSDPDLKPRSFAQGGRPDIVIEFDDTVLVIEVSLMTGVTQWEHEGSSVITHLDQITQKFPHKTVQGLFLVDEINYRSWWQFFVLNKNSWLGQPLSVAPLNIRQFTQILKSLYKNKNQGDIYTFDKLINQIIQSAYDADNYKAWEAKIPRLIKNYK